MRSLAVLLLALAPAAALGQEPTPTPAPTPTPEVTPEPAVPQPEVSPVPETVATPAPPPDFGRFQLGKFWLTPSLRVGNLTYDSNVLNQPTGLRQSDVSASAGPGLLSVLPYGSAGRFEIDGTLQYLYFAKTISQRRLIGAARGSLKWETEPTQFDLSESWSRTNSRPDPEVDERLLRDVEGTSLDLRRRLSGPYFFSLRGSRNRTKILQTESFLGNDLQKNLTRDKYIGGGELEYALSVKTSVVGGGDRQWDSFPLDATRDGSSERFYGGIRVTSDTLLSGQLELGVRRFRRDFNAAKRQLFYSESQLLWSFSPRTQIGAGYHRDLDYSAFDTDGQTPTIRKEVADGFVNKELSGRIDIRMFVSHTSLLTDGAVTIVTPDGEVQTGVRNDRYWRYGANLGYYIRQDLRFGVEGVYNQRQADVDYFGIRGFLFGVTLTYGPPQPSY